MSPSVHERLQDLKPDVQDLRVLPAAAVRARGRRRGRRQLAVSLAAGAVALVGVGAGVAVAWPQQQRTADTPGVPAAGSRMSCVVALPKDPSQVRVRVLGGAAPANLLNETIGQLRARGFTVLTGTAEPNPARTATLRYGPAAVGSAGLMRAALDGDVAMRFDPARPDGTIDLTIGPAFTRLATATEMNQYLVAAGAPSVPPECQGG